MSPVRGSYPWSSGTAATGRPHCAAPISAPAARAADRSESVTGSAVRVAPATAVASSDAPGPAARGHGDAL